MNWLLARLKAVAALLIPGITLALLHAIEKGFDVDVGPETEAMIVSAVTATFVHEIPNIQKAGG